jgi:hypothetical protein
MLGNVGFLVGMVLLAGLFLRRETASWVPLLVLPGEPLVVRGQRSHGLQISIRVALLPNA